MGTYKKTHAAKVADHWSRCHLVPEHRAVRRHGTHTHVRFAQQAQEHRVGYGAKPTADEGLMTCG